MKAELTADRLRELLDYNPETGIFTRRCSLGNTKAGSIVESKEVKGYIRVNIDGSRYKAHRLAWLYVYGSFPNNQIDHINGIPDDNRIANLRVVNARANCLNQTRVRKNNTHGHHGVTQIKKTGRWRARIGNRHIGCFASAHEAHKAYLQEKNKELREELSES